MNEHTIQRLKHKFILTAMLSFAAVMLFMAAAIYLTNLAMSRSEIREVMAYIISNQGYLTESADEDLSEDEADSDTTESLLSDTAVTEEPTEEPSAEEGATADDFSDTAVTEKLTEESAADDSVTEGVSSDTAVTEELTEDLAADETRTMELTAGDTTVQTQDQTQEDTVTENAAETTNDGTGANDITEENAGSTLDDTPAEGSTLNDTATGGTTLNSTSNDDSEVADSAAATTSAGTSFRSVTGIIQQPGRGTGSDLRNQLQNLFGVGSNYDSPEFFYSTRYFAVLYDAEGAVSNVITQHIAAINRDQAVRYADQVKKSWIHFGSFGDYYYQVEDADDGTSIVVFLDCTSTLAISRRIMYVSLILIGFGMLLSWIVLRSVSNRVVQPEIRNAEMQKSFITNASHELKTPLAVIRANTELQEMMTGENEWTQSTLRQVDRMQGLIQNLVMISRAQEQDNKVERTNIDVSKAVTETVKTFAPVASQEGKEMVSQIQEGLMMEAEEGQIRQLTSVLVDNAIKYCDEKGTITVILDRKNRSRSIRLAVSNNYAAGKNEDYRRFFDRFYRADQSHNQDKGGYGIGLSIAQNLVEQYHGTINASWADGIITFTCML